MRIGILNGPNLNLLGEREETIYGTLSFERFLEELQQKFDSIEFFYFQSNVEGEIINCLHNWRHQVDGIVLNAGAYTHTSLAIADAVKAISPPVIEVHISNIYARESYRHTSMTAGVVLGQITGLGLESYTLAIQYFMSLRR